MEFLESLMPMKLSLSDMSGSSLEGAPLARLVFIWSDSETAYCKIPFAWGHLLKIFRGSLSSQLPEAVE